MSPALSSEKFYSSLQKNQILSLVKQRVLAHIKNYIGLFSFNIRLFLKKPFLVKAFSLVPRAITANDFHSIKTLASIGSHVDRSKTIKIDVGLVDPF